VLVCSRVTLSRGIVKEKEIGGVGNYATVVFKKEHPLGFLAVLSSTALVKRGTSEYRTPGVIENN
jgi:hypothetical protein